MNRRRSEPEIATCANCHEPIPACQCERPETYELSTGPACPYCGHMERACDSDGLLFSEDTTEWDCGDCGKTYDVGVNISFSWSASRQEGKQK
jgi:DNA-directed RNA polymerase subunit RPC12/RpoP